MTNFILHHLIPIGITPLLLIFARTSAQNLLLSLLLGNPFTILLLFTILDIIQNRLSNQKFTLKSIATFKGKLARFKFITNSALNDDIDKTNLPCRRSSISRHESIYNNKEQTYSRKVSYFRLWLISTHATLLYCFSNYNLTSLQFSFAEWNTLSLPYLLLTIMLIKLRYSIIHIKNCNQVIDGRGPRAVRECANHENAIEICSMSNSSATNDNYSSIDVTDVHDRTYNDCKIVNWLTKTDSTIIYEKLLVDPSLSLDIWQTSGVNEKPNKVLISKNSNKTDEQEREEHSFSLTNDENENSNDNNSNCCNSRRTKSKESTMNPRSLFQINPRYILICNILHLMIMLAYFYMNITFACASQIITRYLSFILMPINCNYIFDEETNRVAMFCATYSAQIFLAQLAFLSKTMIIKNN